MTKNPALDQDALYAKSKVYIRRGFRSKAGGDAEEYQLWASLALELIGKSCLSKVHPSLVADPTHYQSLFAACGHSLSPDVKTITAKTLFERLSHIHKSFDARHQRFCEQMALRRNAEIHSGESPFSGMNDSWEKDFWGAAETILSMQGETLESWLGSEDAKQPAEILAQVEKALDLRIHHRISRCKSDFEDKHKNPKERQAVIDKSKFLTWRDMTWDGTGRCACPACSSFGFLGGSLWSEDVIDREPSYPDPNDEYGWSTPTETVLKTFSVESFECPVCGLSAFGTKEIAAAELPAEFTEEEVRDREFGDEYGND